MEEKYLEIFSSIKFGIIPVDRGKKKKQRIVEEDRGERAFPPPFLSRTDVRFVIAKRKSRVGDRETRTNSRVPERERERE